MSADQNLNPEHIQKAEAAASASSCRACHASSPCGCCRFLRLWLLAAVGALALAGILAWWLNLPDEHTWQIVLAVVVAILWIKAVVCLVYVIFAGFHEKCAADAGAPPTRSACLMRLACKLYAFFFWLLIFALIELPVLWLRARHEQFAVRFAQLLHLPPRFTTGVLCWIAWALFWIVVPGLLIPFGSMIARSGFAALKRSEVMQALSALRRWRYWIGFAAALAVGICIPLHLVGWIPRVRSAHAEITSATLRFAAAYVLAVTALLLLSWNTARVLASISSKGAANNTPRE